MTYEDKTRASVDLCMAERGYMVVGIKPLNPTRYEIGEVVPHCCGADLDCAWKVTAETDHEDWLAQCQLIADKLPNLGLDVSKIVKGDSYYRIVKADAQM